MKVERQDSGFVSDVLANNLVGLVKLMSYISITIATHTADGGSKVMAHLHNNTYQQ